MTYFVFVKTIMLHIFQESMKYPIKYSNYWCSQFYKKYDVKKKASFLQYYMLFSAYEVNLCPMMWVFQFGHALSPFYSDLQILVSNCFK